MWWDLNTRAEYTGSIWWYSRAQSLARVKGIAYCVSIGDSITDQVMVVPWVVLKKYDFNWSVQMQEVEFWLLYSGILWQVELWPGKFQEISTRLLHRKYLQNETAAT